jgi:hypothetical protein
VWVLKMKSFSGMECLQSRTWITVSCKTADMSGVLVRCVFAILAEKYQDKIIIYAIGHWRRAAMLNPIGNLTCLWYTIEFTMFHCFFRCALSPTEASWGKKSKHTEWEVLQPILVNSKFSHRITNCKCWVALVSITIHITYWW